MPAVYVDTMEDWLRIRGTLEPVYITSKTRGKVLVPCANTVLVLAEMVVRNLYNPNSVPTEKLHALVDSIVESGFCFPIVAIWDDEQGRFVIIDGFHRRLVSGDEWLDLDYVPVVVLDATMAQRMAATWRFNKARGSHQVDLDAELIRKLIEQGLADADVAQQLGVDLDTVYRYKQVTGVAALFANVDFSPSWEMVDRPDSPSP